MEQAKWSVMSGKLQGISALNTDTTSNSYCKAMSKKKDTICSMCYSWNMLQTFRKNCVPRFKQNSDYLSSKVHDVDYLPSPPGPVNRFNGHGEIINKNHLENLLRICENNPRMTFSLWTKKDRMVSQYIRTREGQKPKNLILIYSNPYPNTVAKLPPGFDKTFNNVTTDSKDINCDAKCKDCMMCYTINDKTTTIIEKVK